MPDRVPKPNKCLQKAIKADLMDQIIEISGRCLNMALEAARDESQPQNRVFSPQNWIKAKDCLHKINFAIRNYFAMLPSMPQGKELDKKLNEALQLENEDFEYRWAAD